MQSVSDIFWKVTPKLQTLSQASDDWDEARRHLESWRLVTLWLSHPGHSGEVHPPGELLQEAVAAPGIVVNLNTLKQFDKGKAIHQMLVTFMVFGNNSSPPSVVSELSSSLSHSKDSKPTKASSLH